MKETPPLSTRPSSIFLLSETKLSEYFDTVSEVFLQNRPESRCNESLFTQFYLRAEQRRPCSKSLPGLSQPAALRKVHFHDTGSLQWIVSRIDVSQMVKDSNTQPKAIYRERIISSIRSRLNRRRSFVLKFRLVSKDVPIREVKRTGYFLVLGNGLLRVQHNDLRCIFTNR